MAESDTGHEPLAIYWTLHRDAGPPVTCELSRTEHGLWVRCLDQPRNVLLTERVETAAAGLAVAAEWKARLLGLREYFERPRPRDRRRP